jgi:hypothetical protein
MRACSLCLASLTQHYICETDLFCSLSLPFVLFCCCIVVHSLNGTPFINLSSLLLTDIRF